MSEEPELQRPMQGLASLPVFFKLRDRRVLLAGDGAGAAWKAELLQATGARVDVFSPAPGAEMRRLAAQSSAVSLISRAWRPEDFTDAALAIGDLASEDEAARFRDAAHAAGVPVNVVDKPDYCDFQFGTIIDRSPLVAAISTAGAAPVFALALRGRLEALLPPSLKQWAEAAQAWRPQLNDPPAQRRFWELFVTRALGARAPQDRDFIELMQLASAAAAAPEDAFAVIVAATEDPELLSLRALRLLQAAEVVVHDAAIPQQIVDMGRRESPKIACATGNDAILRLVPEVRNGKRVAWLTARAPATEDIAALARAGIKAEIVGK